MNLPFSDENGMRDFIFRNYKETFPELIKGKKQDMTWEADGFPSLRFLIQQNAEKRINKAVEDLNSLVLDGKEVHLERSDDSTTRIDLLGRTLEGTGLTIIELKKSKQTERQAFTELLGYANHFSVLFPGLGDHNILSVLVAPMGNRVVRDAYFQELVTNRKNVVALIPKVVDGDLSLEVYYPDEQYYKWFEDNIIDDRAYVSLVASFPEIDGIETDRDNNGKLPEESVDALNTLSSLIAQKLEAIGLHGMVYARQRFGETAEIFPDPNSIIVSVLSPFSGFRNDSDNTSEGRMSELQTILGQLKGVNDEWFESIHFGLQSTILRIVQECFDISFRQVGKPTIQPEYDLVDWEIFKNTFMETVHCHNLKLYTTGLIRDIYHEYIKYIYSVGQDDIYFSDDLPQYSYDTFNNFLAVWQILWGLSLRGEDQEV